MPDPRRLLAGAPLLLMLVLGACATDSRVRDVEARAESAAAAAAEAQARAAKVEQESARLAERLTEIERRYAEIDQRLRAAPPTPSLAPHRPGAAPPAASGAPATQPGAPPLDPRTEAAARRRASYLNLGKRLAAEAGLEGLTDDQAVKLHEHRQQTEAQIAALIGREKQAAGGKEPDRGALRKKVFDETDPRLTAFLSEAQTAKYRAWRDARAAK
ncbi:MAG: hypothetical protein HY719_13630 [Planctomycetes bacterium]|nr:hypothetical protein [Planctomycetota bacterium]